MGKINILKSEFIGKVGAVYGVKQYDKTYAKAVPFSHTPHNAVQKECFSALQDLNRMTSFIAKAFWYYMPLSDRTMYKNNAITKLFKPVIKNKTFQPENLAEVIINDSSTRIINFTFDEIMLTFSCEIVNIDSRTFSNDEKLLIMLVQDNGKVRWGATANGSRIEFQESLDSFYSDKCYLIVFKSVIIGKKKTLRGLSIATWERT